MTMADVQTQIIEPMQRIFLPVRNMEQAETTAALREYADSLQRFDGLDLAAAWQTVKETHVTRSWPLVATFVKAAYAARGARIESARPERSGEKGKSARAVRWDTWKAVSRSPMAQEAARKGVAWSLKCLVLHDGKRPEQIDIRELVSGHERAARTAARIENGEGHEWRGRMLKPLGPKEADMALRMYHAIQVREAQTQQEINYGVPDEEREAA